MTKLKNFYRGILLLFKTIKLKLIRRYNEFTESEPMNKEEYIYRMVSTLRREFPMATQNEILLSVSQRLNMFREKDAIQMKAELEQFKLQKEFLKSKVDMSNEKY